MPRQFTVRVKNEPGQLALLAQRLAEQGVDIRTIGVGAVGSSGCVVLATNNDTATREALRRARYTFAEGEVLSVSVEDRPGALADLAQRIARAGVNVVSVMVLGRRQGKADLAITVDDIEQAQRALSGGAPAARAAGPSSHIARAQTNAVR